MKLLRAVLVWACVLQVAVMGQEIYCEPKDCYEILNVPQDATVKEIRKQYRALSRKYHPDISKDPDAVVKFREIALANEILSDVEERAEYDYYLKHPEEAFYNKMRYYRRRYAPKSDPFQVVGFFVLFISVLQYVLQSRMNRKAVEYFKSHDKKFQLRVKAAAMEEWEKTQQQNTGKRRKKKPSKEEMQLITARVTEELAQEIDVQGGYKKPEILDMFAFRLLFLPYTVVKNIQWHFKWWYRHSYKEEPLDDDEKLYLIAKAFGTSVDALTYNTEEEELWNMIDQEVWIPENKKKYEMQLLKRKYPGKYKQMLRYMKQHEE